MMASRWFTPLLLTASLGLAALSPAAMAQSISGRVIVDIGDVAMRGGVPYYRNGGYGPHDRLFVQHDHHGRPVYYRTVYADRGHGYSAPRHGGGHASYGNVGYGNAGHGGGHGNGHGRAYSQPGGDHDRGRGGH